MSSKHLMRVYDYLRSQHRTVIVEKQATAEDIETAGI
jgi:DNA-binding CsgD family transcriptional regulator